MNGVAWTVLALAMGAAAALALAWLRPPRAGMTSPLWMLLLSTGGMLAGLWLDARDGGLARLAALCAASPPDPASVLAWHWVELPLAHLGMVLGGLAVIPLMPLLRPACRRQFCASLGQNLACSAWMLLGMAAGTLALADLADEPAPLLAGMLAGMAWGMVVSVLLYRRGRRRQALKSQPRQQSATDRPTAPGRPRDRAAETP